MANNKALLNDDEDLEFLQSLKNDFYEESKESLEKAESSLLNFESSHSELSLLDYKRTLHSIKGSAKAVDESEFAALIHRIEDTVAGEKNEKFFEINFKFLDLAKNYISFGKSSDTNEMKSVLEEISTLF